MEIIVYFLICFFATTIGGISGIGGGVIIKPILDSFSPIEISAISFLSGCTVLSMSVVSVLRAGKGEEKVQLKLGSLLVIGAALGGIAGKFIFDWLQKTANNSQQVGIIQNSIMVILTVGVFIYVLNKDKIKTRHTENPIACIFIGLFLGLTGAFLGIGGGPINLVVLYYFFSMNTKTAAINSIFIILFSQSTSLVSTIVQGKIPTFDIFTLILMVVGGILGGFAGRYFTKKLTTAQINKLFSIVLIGITAISIYNIFKFAII